MTQWLLRLVKPGRVFGWALLIAACASAGAPAAEIAVRFAPFQKGAKLVVEVDGLSDSVLQRLQARAENDLPAILAVRVDGARAAMLGTYTVQNGRLRFESRFPGSPGLKYRAEFDPRKVPVAGAAKPIGATMTAPAPPAVATTQLVRIFPTRDRLPENQLKFYLHFSASMGRGDAYAHIRLIDDKGKVVFNPFLELGEELWDADARRFTLFLHPGRIKRGLKMRDELGPILEEGHGYTLIVDAKWPDAEGNPLQKEFRKSFSVDKPDDTQPDPRAWTMQVPAAGSANPVTVDFPDPLDHALLNRVVWIEDWSGTRVAGSIGISREETRWRFTPRKAWAAGKYKLVAETILEDLAGNSIARPFEVDIVQPLPQRKRDKTASRNFEIK